MYRRVVLPAPGSPFNTTSLCAASSMTCSKKFLTKTSFFFSSRRRHTRCSRDWSSDVCSSDLVVTVGPAEDLKQPDQRLLASELARFIRAIRTVLPAAAAAGQAEMFRRGYAFVAPEAAAFLNDYFANPANDPRLLGLRLTRQVDVTGVLRVPHSDVWRLQWTETERSTQPGGLMRTLAWEGYVTVRLVPPRTVDAVQDNPLGLAVTSVNWTQVGASASAGPLAGADTTLDQGVKP